MKTYWDTSGLIRAYVLRQKPEGVTRAHSVSEFFCVLSGPGLVKFVMAQGRVKALVRSLALNVRERVKSAVYVKHLSVLWFE